MYTLGAIEYPFIDPCGTKWATLTAPLRPKLKLSVHVVGNLHALQHMGYFVTREM